MSDHHRDTINQYKFVIGIDEVGWGAVAGPLVLAAAVFPTQFQHAKIKDSKKFTTHKARAEVLQKYVEPNAVCLLVESVSVWELESIGPGAAIQKALKNLADKAIKHFPEDSIIVVDGSHVIKGIDHPQIAIAKADSLVTAVSAASIRAKVTRDTMMQAIGPEYHVFGFHNNKGYPTMSHFRALKEHGATCHHRSYIPQVKEALAKKGMFLGSDI